MWVLAACVVGVPCGAEETAPAAGAAVHDAEATKFLRVVRDAQRQPTALETAVTRYAPSKEPEGGVTVDLIGAVHVGEGHYYDQLNELFASYDVVLYELVAPEGTRVVPGESNARGNPVSFLQHMMKNVLKLEFQLDRIDYSRANLVHADMSPQEFAQSMKDRGESFLTMFMRILRQSMTASNRTGSSTTDAELLVALVAKDRALRLKRILADQFESMEEQLAALEGPDGSTIITQRNKKALDVLRREIDRGHRRLAVFYGAGHLPDMERRLESDFGLKRASQRWLVAWTIGPQDAPTKEESTESKPADAEPAGTP